MPSRLLLKLYGSLIQIIQLPISTLRKATIRSYQQYSRSSIQTIANSTYNNTSLATTIYVLLQSIPSRYINPYITQRALNRLSLLSVSRLTKNIYRPYSTYRFSLILQSLPLGLISIKCPNFNIYCSQLLRSLQQRLRLFSYPRYYNF